MKISFIGLGPRAERVMLRAVSTLPFIRHQGLNLKGMYNKTFCSCNRF
jgi:hypothetical protein